MSENLTFITKKWIQNKIAWILLITPLCFKVEIIPGVIVLPQEIILPFLIFLYFLSQKNRLTKVSKVVTPYIFLLLAFFITSISTFFSFLSEFDPIGLLKLLKYSTYVISIIVLHDYKFLNFEKRINIVGIFTVLLTLVVFYVTKINSGKSWHTFIAIATYFSEYMPTGFSNRVFNLYTQSFVVYSGNHGIYGSFLVLLFFFNLSCILRKKVKYIKINYLTMILSFINIMMLTSRETFLLIFVVIFSFSIYRISYLKFKISKVIKVLTFFSLFIILLIFFIVYFEIELSIVNKVTSSIKGFREKGGDGSVNVRFNTWLIILIYLFTNPWRLIIGTGFNPTLFRNKLNLVAEEYPNIGDYVGIPESLFIQFLSYGGVLSMFFVLLFLIYSFKSLFKKIKNSYCLFLPFYVIGIAVTNNTGASIIAELLMTQFGLIYLFIMNSNEENQHSLYNSKV
jgi:hypothetical protein